MARTHQRIIIAHHLHTIRHADVIFVVNEAEVVEQGTHDTLLAKGGVYARLHEIQAAGVDELIVTPLGVADAEAEELALVGLLGREAT